MSCRLALSRMTGQVSRFFGDETSPCGGAPVDHARRRWRAKILARAGRAEADRARRTAHRPLNKLEPVEIGPRGPCHGSVWWRVGWACDSRTRCERSAL